MTTFVIRWNVQKQNYMVLDKKVYEARQGADVHNIVPPQALDERQEFKSVAEAVVFLLRKGKRDEEIRMSKEFIELIRNSMKDEPQFRLGNMNQEFTSFYAVWTKPVDDDVETHRPVKRTYRNEKNAKRALVSMSYANKGKKFFLFKAVARSVDGIMEQLPVFEQKEKLKAQLGYLVRSHVLELNILKMDELIEKINRLVDDA